MTTLWKLTDEGFVATVPHEVLRTVANVDDGLNVANSEFRLVDFRDGARPSHALIATADVPVRVNGSIAVGGLCVLRHKDEILVGSQKMFFSAESAPVVEIYRRDDSRRPPRCPICRAEIQDGQSIVHCPGCSRLYHQIEAADDSPSKPCWTYSPVCRFCDHPTSMSGEPIWRPDEE